MSVVKVLRITGETFHHPIYADAAIEHLELHDSKVHGSHGTCHFIDPDGIITLSYQRERYWSQDTIWAIFDELAIKKS